MDNRTKNIIYSLVLMGAVLLVGWYRRSSSAASEPMKIEGQTMGTSYHLTYFDEQKRDFKVSVDSLLKEVNKSINTYDPESEVSRFNRDARGVKRALPYLVPPLEVAREVYDASEGAFDPTVMPLVNVWGFGPGRRLKMESARVDSIKAFVGFEKIQITKDSVLKSHPYTQLDFGGIGQGYGADVIADFLESKGISNMLVELGGEGMAIGKNLKSGNPWEIGILDPASTYENQFFKAYASISNLSFTTSGNYFNFHEIDGVKYSHTIDPGTGFPSRKAILSASVFAKDCTTADAWGTAFMVMGHEKAIETAKAHPELHVFLMYSNENGKVETFMTSNLEKIIKLEKETQ